ncbi:YfiR family protein [Psychromonas sp. KJ10-10]
MLAGKIRFEVNPDKLKQSGIQMSSKVLRLGRTNKADH